MIRVEEKEDFIKIVYDKRLPHRITGTEERTLQVKRSKAIKECSTEFRNAVTDFCAGRDLDRFRQHHCVMIIVTCYASENDYVDCDNMYVSDVINAVSKWTILCDDMPPALSVMNTSITPDGERLPKLYDEREEEMDNITHTEVYIVPLEKISCFL